MAQSSLEERIRELATPLAAGLGLDIWGMELAFGARSLVRIYVEKNSPALLPDSPEGTTQVSPASASQDSVGQDFPERASDGRAFPGSAVSGTDASLSSDTDEEFSVGDGVSIKQCAELSRLLGLSLEVEDIIPGAYVLEISSPGLDRTFFTAAQLATASGRVVELTLENPHPDVQGRRKFRGELSSVPAAPEEGVFVIKAEDTPKPGMETEISFPFADVKKVKQVFLPPEKTLPGKGAKQAKKPAKGKQ